MQKLLINSVGERDFSAQETCHLLLQLPMFKASRDFVVLSLDGSRAVDERLDEDQPATVASALDHYVSRPATANFESMTLLHFVQHYSMPRESGSEPSKRRKKVVVIVRPYCTKYEQYCRQKLMLHVPFRNQRELLGNHTTFTAAYAEFLQSVSIPPSLEDDIHRLQQSSQQPSEDDTEVSRGLNLHTRAHALTCMQYSSHFRNRAMNSPASDLPGLGMLICQSNADLQPGTESQEDVDWSAGAQRYPNVEEMPTFISRQRESAGQHSFTTTADPQHLQGKQLQAYNIVREHAEADHPDPLRLIVQLGQGSPT